MVEEDLFTKEKKYVANFKKAVLLVAGAAVQKLMASLAKEQEVLMYLADMLIETYVSESVQLRVEKLAGQRGEEGVKEQIDMMQVYIRDAADKIFKAGKEALNSFAEGDERRMMMTGLKRYTKTDDINTTSGTQKNCRKADRTKQVLLLKILIFISDTFNFFHMEHASRLFDCINIQARNQKADFLNAKVDGAWKSYSTGEVHEKIYQLAAALLEMGISAGDGTVEGRDKIGLISNSRPEWLIVDLAVQLTGAILVPLYPNTSLKEIEQILTEAEVKCIFVSDADLSSKVNSVKDRVPSLRSVFSPLIS